MRRRGRGIHHLIRSVSPRGFSSHERKQGRRGPFSFLPGIRLLHRLFSGRRGRFVAHQQPGCDYARSGTARLLDPNPGHDEQRTQLSQSPACHQDESVATRAEQPDFLLFHGSILLDDRWPEHPAIGYDAGEQTDPIKDG